MVRWMWAAAAVAACLPTAWAFCGFYVAQEPGNLFNKSSKVVLARKGDHTVLTMANDYEGDPAQFGIVIPVPQEITPEMVSVADGAVISKLEQYTVPRLAEYFDDDPCPAPVSLSQLGYLGSGVGSVASIGGGTAAGDMGFIERARAFGVRVERTWDVAEYDVVVIQAEDGAGLKEWLALEGWQVPEGSGPILDSYIQQNMHFFLAKVDLEQREASSRWLRPIQVRYDSPKFMLPIRLGTVNAGGAQDLIVLALTEKGRIETTNYRTAKVPAEVELPEYLADQQNFGTFYEALFDRRVRRDGMSNVYLEYAWPLSISCDPCSGAALSAGELAKLGASWASEYHGGVEGGFVTRLHVRYDAAHFPEDLVFQETADRQPWQARYIVRHRYQGDTECEAGVRYETALAARQEREISSLARLTGWSPEKIRTFVPPRPWK